MHVIGTIPADPYVGMKPIISQQDKTPRDTRSFRLPKPLLSRFDSYCKQMDSAPSYVLGQILNTWLDEYERMRQGQKG
jgi:DNA replicative helicase MCM subunit Mcm2 (Cdc46/Mcm family)